jgi:hypothetical protein
MTYDLYIMLAKLLHSDQPLPTRAELDEVCKAYTAWAKTAPDRSKRRHQ